MGEAKRKAEPVSMARQVLSACIFQAELTTYNEAGQVCLRPKLVNFGYLEADIPEDVRAWLLNSAKRAQTIVPDPGNESKA